MTDRNSERRVDNRSLGLIHENYGNETPSWFKPHRVLQILSGPLKKWRKKEKKVTGNRTFLRGAEVLHDVTPSDVTTYGETSQCGNEGKTACSLPRSVVV